jgi:hypothetical protein
MRVLCKKWPKIKKLTISSIVLLTIYSKINKTTTLLYLKQMKKVTKTKQITIQAYKKINKTAKH